MSMFSFTRQERMMILFLVTSLCVGSLITLLQRRSPGFAPELRSRYSAQHGIEDTVSIRDTLLASSTPDTVVTARLNINTATREEMMCLPGIGPAMAGRIIEYRRLRGPFGGPDDLKGVNGIGDKTVKRLNPLIKFE